MPMSLGLKAEATKRALMGLGPPTQLPPLEQQPSKAPPPLVKPPLPGPQPLPAPCAESALVPASAEVVPAELMSAASVAPSAADEIELLDPAMPWDDADWDLIIVLPLPEDLAAKAEAVQAAEQKSKQPRPQKGKKAAEGGADATSEQKLRNALQLDDMVDEACEGGGKQRSSNAWLLAELRERVLQCGLCCKVLKLMPGSDATAEAPGEHEIESGHGVALLCIGAHKHVKFERAPPPPAKGAPPLAALPAKTKARRVAKGAPTAAATDTAMAAGSTGAKEAKVALKQAEEQELLRRSARRGAERFPRLELEAEAQRMRLETKQGARAEFTRSGFRAFPPFRSELRQRIEAMILEAPRSTNAQNASASVPSAAASSVPSAVATCATAATSTAAASSAAACAAPSTGQRGAGLRLDQLVASGRVLELVHVHDDDEVTALKTLILKSAAGVLPIKRSTLAALHAYVGGELSFYFAWLAAYTRSLWVPAIVGALMYMVDYQQYDALLDEYYNVTHRGNASGQWYYSQLDGVVLSDRLTSAGVVRALLISVFGLVIVQWSAIFEEVWKRTSARIATDWGENDVDKPPRPVNRAFRPCATKPGFYTRDGLFVSLAPTNGSSAEEVEQLRVLEMPPRDAYYPECSRLERQLTSAAVLVTMTATCLLCVFSMQLFAAYCEDSGQPSYYYSTANAVMISVFNALWRSFALRLSARLGIRPCAPPRSCAPQAQMIAVRCSDARA